VVVALEITVPYDQFFRHGSEYTAPARVQQAGLKPLKATAEIWFNLKEAVRGSVLSSCQ
jgi:hypothetical protein